MICGELSQYRKPVVRIDHRNAENAAHRRAYHLGIINVHGAAVCEDGRETGSLTRPEHGPEISGILQAFDREEAACAFRQHFGKTLSLHAKQREHALRRLCVRHLCKNIVGDCLCPECLYLFPNFSLGARRKTLAHIKLLDFRCGCFQKHADALDRK